MAIYRGVAGMGTEMELSWNDGVEQWSQFIINIEYKVCQRFC